MAGKRVLLAAEISRGGSTLTRLLPLAAALARRGCDVSVAVPAGFGAAAFRCPVVEAPGWRMPPPPGYVANSYPDVLMHCGYAAPDALRGLMTGWRGLLDQIRPDLLVADFAPTAMLAWRVAGLPIAAVGDGFSLPPLSAPLPSLRPWVEIPEEAIESIEGRVLAVINARLGALRSAEMGDLRDLFDGVPLFPCTFPEFDHYPDREDGEWYGAVFPDRRAPRSIQLDPRHPALRPVTAALRRVAGSEAVVVCQGQDAAIPALLAGKPVLLLPVFVEEMMTLHRLMAQGLGHGLDPNGDEAAAAMAVSRLMDDAACHARVADFARRYHGYQPALAVDAVADEIEDLLSGQAAV